MIKSETIGTSTLYNCDCLELLKTLPDKSIDLAICDPPYGGGNHKMCNYKNNGKWQNKFGDKIDKWDIAPNENYFNELLRVADKVIIWGGNNYDLPPNRNFIIWHKPKMCGDNFSMAQAEFAWTNIDGNSKVFSYSQFELERIHPCQKPIQLYKWLLQKYAKQGDKILDTHFGSASIAVACNELGFELIASEIDEDYYNMACHRVREADRQQLLFREAV